jgi:thymidine phosphorylase
MPLIRKITIGREYKENSMHFSVGQEVYGKHRIVDIQETDDLFILYIQDQNSNIKQWKDFNKNMAISVEYNLEY